MTDAAWRELCHFMVLEAKLFRIIPGPPPVVIVNQAEQEDWAAVSEALDTLEQGEQGLSLEEAFEAVRRNHGIPTDE